MAETLSKTALANANALLVIENAELRARVAELEAHLQKSPGFQPEGNRAREFRTSFQGVVVPGSEAVNQDRPSFELVALNGYQRRVITENDEVAALMRKRRSPKDVNFVCEIRPTGMWVKSIGVESATFIMDRIDPYADRNDVEKKRFGLTGKGSRIKIVSLESDGILDRHEGEEVEIKGTFLPVKFKDRYYTQFYTEAALASKMKVDADCSGEIPF